MRDNRNTEIIKQAATSARMDRFKKLVEKKMATTSVIIPEPYKPKKLTL